MSHAPRRARAPTAATATSRLIQHHYGRRPAPVRRGQARHLALPRAGEPLFFSARCSSLTSSTGCTTRRSTRTRCKYLEVKFGAINTAVLIFSSLTAAWAVRCAQLSQRRGLIACLVDHDPSAHVDVPRHQVHRVLATRSTSTSCSAATSTRASASGGEELLTKGNECPGSKSTVKWNAGTAKPDAGCFDERRLRSESARARRAGRLRGRRGHGRRQGAGS